MGELSEIPRSDDGLHCQAVQTMTSKVPISTALKNT
jgi:hypothetical protein